MLLCRWTSVRGDVSLHYKTRRNNYLDFHFTFVSDRGGLMSPMLFDPFYGPVAPFRGYGLWGW